MKYDKSDRHILYLLDRDARMPFKQIGEAVRLSRQTVRNRVRRMEENSIIKGYYALIDHTCLGYLSFRTYLKLQNTSPSEEEALLSDMVNRQNVWAVVRVSGAWDVAIVAATENIQQYHDVWNGILDEHIANIDTYSTQLYSPVHHYTRNYLRSGQSVTERVLGKGNTVAIDEADATILRMLCDDARTSLVDIAQQVGMTAQTVKRRKQRLEKEGVITGYRPIIDVEKLGYQFYKVAIRFAELPDVDAFLEYCRQQENIYQVSEIVSGAHIDVEVHVKELQAMRDVMEDCKRSFPDTIRNYDYFRVVSVWKNSFYPA